MWHRLGAALPLEGTPATLLVVDVVHGASSGGHPRAIRDGASSKGRPRGSPSEISVTPGRRQGRRRRKPQVSTGEDARNPSALGDFDLLF